jgi:mannose-6-phosphate isomerase-like protein (cupin superfamily)
MPRKPANPKASSSGYVRSSSAYSAAAPPGSVSRENAEHYRWGDDCDGWHLVKDAHLSVIEELIPPGAAEVRHHHERAQQFFFVLVGEVLMEVEGEMTLVRAGSGIHVRPGTRHQIRNPSSTPARFLVVSQPPSHGDRVDE